MQYKHSTVYTFTSHHAETQFQILIHDFHKCSAELFEGVSVLRNKGDIAHCFTDIAVIRTAGRLHI